MFKDILEAKSLTCYKLSILSGVSYTTINEIYRGERSIDDCTVKVMICLSKALDMSADDFYIKATERMKIPETLYPCFWDTEPSDLNISINKTYIITRLLNKGGYLGLSFLKKAFTYEEIKDVAKHSRNLSPKTASFLANVYHLNKSEMTYYCQKIQDWRK